MSLISHQCEEGTVKKYFIVRQEGKRQVQREIDHYNLDIRHYLLQAYF